ncbi:hypothetical protein hmeg3_11760 [Herbaspirillum sp. meg3]|uniref:Ig-like domain-containing protein n=1 Tax=Herbaspirillum sp. meg3 TaxID=2025949 RepID=UPI000B98D913|nr:Ig-like domain-containing protein [Herbaspirillum sp. meg3]ASU38893.1 hypothetical protein hmeg3_11760 [Herbaspirillum sp. meg3]
MNSTTPHHFLEALDLDAAKPVRTRLQRTPHRLALEQRFMFDGAAVVDAAHAAADTAALAKIAEVPAAVEVRAADPSKNDQKKEVVIVDTSVADYKTLEASIRAGVGIIEIDGSKDGLAQIAKWAETQGGYDSISILSHGADGQLHLGTTTLTDSSLSDTQVQAELAELGHALKAGGDLLLYGCDIAETTNGQTFINDLSQATGADIAASSDATGSAARGGDWTLEYRTGTIEASTLTASAYQGLLTSSTFDFETVAQGTDSNTISQTIGSDTIVITSTDANMLVDTELNAFGSDISNASGKVLASGEGGVFTESRLSLTVAGSKTFDLTSFTLAQLGPDGLSITLTTNKGSETFTASFVGNSWVLNLSTATHPSYFTGVTNVVITTADAGGVFEWGFDNIVLSNITDPNAPPSTTVATAALQHDTGVNGTDFITNVASQTISGTLSASLVTGEFVEVSFDGGISWSSATSSVGSASWSVSTTLSGSNTFEARVTNVNGSSTPFTHTYTFDNVAPTTTVGSLSFSNDTGSSSTDFLTSNPSQTINATLSTTLAAGDVVWGSIDNGATWTDITSKVSGTALTWNGVTLISSNTLKLKVQDAAGNDGTIAQQIYTLDTTAPTISFSSIVFSNDTGTSSSDFITNNPSQTITATLSATPAGTDVVWGSLNNGATWINITSKVSGTTLTWNGVTLTGSNTLLLRVTDAAGNNGTSTSQAYVLDTTAPTIAFSTIGFSNDTGSSNTDLITSNPSQTITATLSGTPAGSDVVWGSLDNGTTWTNITSKVSGTTLTWNGVTLTGSNTLLLRVSDAAGNNGASSSASYTLDSTAPATPGTPTLDASSDTGASSSDKITNDNTPTLSGTAENGSTVTIYDGATLLGTVVAGSSGWSYTTGVLSDGSHVFTVTAKDTAGNVSAASAGLTVTVDTAAPAVNSVTTPANGTYYSGQALDFVVNFGEAVIVDTGSGTPSIAIVVGATTRYATYLSGSGTSALTFRYVVPSGDSDNNGITVGALSANGGTLKDTAGNNATLTINPGSTAAILVDGSQPSITGVSASTADGAYGSSQIVTIVVNFSGAVTVDTTGGIPALTLNSGGTATYTGGSGSSALTFSYTVANGQNSADLDYNSTAALSLNGATIIETGGSHQNVSITLATPGTAGSLGANKDIVIDTTAPTTTFSALSFSGDTGTSNTDFITNTAAQTIRATLSVAPTGSETVYGSLDNGATWTDITSKVSGTSLTWNGVTLTGSNTLQLKVQDAAGNQSTPKTQAYTLDTTAPTITFSNLSLSADNGSSSTDFITNTAAQTITATLSAAPAGTDIVYGSLDNGATWTDITSKVSGTTLTWNGVTLSGSNTLLLRVTDNAGNDGLVKNQNYTVDTTPPTITFSNVALSADTGASNTDFITATAAQTITATLSGAPTGTDRVFGSLDNGVTWTNITAKVTGTTLNWDGVTLLGGNHTLLLKVQNNAGNDGVSANQAYTLEVATITTTTTVTPLIPTNPPVASLDPVIPPPQPTVSVVFTSPAAASLTFLSGESPLSTTQQGWGAPGQNSAALDFNNGERVSLLTAPATQGSYQVVVLERTGSGDSLQVNAPLNDVTFAAGQRISFQVPADAFGHTNPDAVVTLSATTADGRPLPAWLKFSAQSGTFSGQVPTGMRGEVSIRVVARDNQGHEAVQVLKIRLGERAQSARNHLLPGDWQDAEKLAVGRSSLSEQLHASRTGGTDRLAALARSVKVAMTGHA